MPILSLEAHGVGEVHPPFETLVDMFDHAVQTAPDVIALWEGGQTVTYKQLDGAVKGLAADLVAAGASGNTVGLLLPNGIVFSLGYFAILYAGGLPTLLNPAYPPAQLEPILRDAAPELVICTAQTGETLEALSKSGLTMTQVVLSGSAKEIEDFSARAAAPSELPNIGTNSPAALLYTGGTTGISKGVEHTHGMLTDAVRAIEWIWPARTSGEVCLPIAPMFHIYGFLTGALNPVYNCGTVIIPGVFKPDEIIDLIATHKVTMFGGGPPAIYSALLKQSNFEGADLSALRVCPGGGAPFPVELINRWRKATGLTIQEAYGMTEMAPISGNTGTFGNKAGTVGMAIPGCKVEVADLNDKDKILAVGEVGEIRFSGPFAMKGYRNRPDETAETIYDGFIYTGDIGKIDEDGFITITDRKKDVVLVNGFNVFPRDVEEVVFTHPSVQNVGVIGVPDQRSGERVVVFVVSDQGESLAPALKALCEKDLAPYQNPAEFRFMEELPITAANKLDRVTLREIAAETSS
ncbi:MAG: AMP-binding protein [Rhizobiales bacterium]|nr:AMP-binding protein [Hyphomicrobiales bacterium]